MKKNNLYYLYSILFTILLQAAYSQSFLQTQKITASDRKAGDWFYWSSISGDYMVVGAPSNSYNLVGADSMYQAGAAYIYHKNSSGTWIEIQKLIAPDRKALDWFGYSVSIDGNYIVVGAHKQDYDENNLNSMPDAGASYVYEKNIGGTWSFKQKLVASDRHVSAWNGTRVSVSGNYIVSSCNNQCTDVNGGNWLNASGAAYVYRRDNNGNWVQDQKIVAPDRQADDYFGNSVFMSGNLIAVGSVGNDLDENGNNFIKQAGAAYVYEKNSNNVWNFVQKVVAPDRDSMDWFGYAQIAIHNNNLLVGAHWHDKDANGSNPLYDAGAAYVFTRNSGGVYSLKQKLTPSFRMGTENFGMGVAIYGDYLCVGSALNDYDSINQNFAVNTGAAYVFKYNNTTNQWYELQKITAIKRNTMSGFGYSVAMDSTNIIIGAQSEKYDFNEQNYFSWGPGAVYSFKLTHPLSIVENPTDNYLFYPNPFVNNLNLILNQNEQPKLISIIDSKGNNVYTNSYFESPKIEIKTNEWSSGIYFLQIVYDNKTISKKIICVK